MIRPITGPHGVGFFAMESQPQYAQYNEQHVGRYWNYLVTPDCYEWPEAYKDVFSEKNYVIDGFSPNLNKSLHIGHLRQLALAKSLKGMLGHKVKFVSLLGASQGVYKYATDGLQWWYTFLGFEPAEVYYDVLMPRDQDIVPRRKTKMPMENKIATDIEGKPFESKEECEVWDGPKGTVIVVRWDGRPTYAFAEIAFAKTVGPTHYITGAEQKEHFESLGLGDKHLAMGLVLGKDGKKLKSRDGDEAVLAEGVLKEIMANLDDTCPTKHQLAWNVLAWNFLTVARTQNVKYVPEEWTNPDAPGMYITYTYARVKKALEGLGLLNVEPPCMKAHCHRVKPVWDESKRDFYGAVDEWHPLHPDPQYDLTQEDANLLGFADYYKYYLKRAIDTMDPTHMATYTHDLARRLGKAYHSEKIQGGRYGFQYAVSQANRVLRRCMAYLGMFDIEKV